MDHVLSTGKPILIDLLTNRAGTFVVSRIPLRDEQGEVIGVLGIVLFDHPETTQQPLITKFANLQRDLNEARRELASQRRAKYTFASFVGASSAAQEVKRQARRAAQSASPVLLLGETGTGKELLAHAIHASSPRAGRAFVSVNMAAVPEALLEAEFFGVAPGAYTGADRKGRDGKFKLADGGTLFLDELGDMPMAVQVKLLRALQDGEIEPLGSNRIVRCDVRVVAATSRDLQRLVRDGLFREDLYYRLHVLPIRLPALRERRDDIPLLIEALCEDMATRGVPMHLEFSPEAMALLQAQSWRGNIRELRNVLEQLALRGESARVGRPQVEQVLRDAGLDQIAAPIETVAQSASPVGEHTATSVMPLAEQVKAVEQQAVRAALLQTQGNRAAAARVLDMSRANLYDKLKAWGWMDENQTCV
jgi:transcriptional regulator with PAS, ATPase and Fis domain